MNMKKTNQNSISIQNIFKLIQFRVIPYFFSQYAWVAILTLFACIPFMLPHKNSTGQIISNSKYEPFNHTQIPAIFTHLSDIHIDHFQPDKSFYFDQAISLIINRLKPDFNILTGDFANNFPSYDGIIAYSRQQHKDIEIYEKLSQRLRDNSPIIENDGNHDAFAIYNYETKRNQAKIYQNKTLQEYRISIHSFDINGRNYTFIALNPFNFPSPHSPFLFYAHPPKEFYDLLEKTIDQIPEENEIIITDHFPYLLWKFGPKSSSGKTFHDILKNKKIGFFLNGHLHTPDPFYMHYNGLLEIVGSDLKEHQKFSLAVIDNGRLSYHPITLTETREDTVFSFITNPLPDYLLSNHQIFNEKETYVRMIIYKNEEPLIKVSVYPNVFENHQLTCKKTFDKNGDLRFWLCETDIKVPNYGKYILNVTGDVEKKLEFTIDEKIPSYLEEVYTPIDTYVIPYEVQLAIIWFFMLIIVFPFIHVPDHINNKFEMWINGESSESMWIYSIVFGFLAVKSRIDKLPNLIRYSLFISVLWPICLPFLFMTIDKHFGFIWTWGFVCNGPHYGVWGQMFALIYLSCFILPITLLFSALAISFPLRWTIIIDILPTIGCLSFNLYELFLKHLIESGNVIGMIFSTYTLAIIYFYTLMIVWRGCWKKGLKQNSLIPSTSLLDNESHEY